MHCGCVPYRMNTAVRASRETHRSDAFCCRPHGVHDVQGSLAAAASQQGISVPPLPPPPLPHCAHASTCGSCLGPERWAPGPDTAVAEALCQVAAPAVWLPAALAAVVRRSSRRQALAGLVATSPGKSLAYVGAKLWKRLMSAA